MADDCKDGLVQNVDISNMSYTSQLAWLMSIDQETYEQHKHDISRNISGIGDWGEIDANDDYSKFDETRRKFKEEVGYKYDQAQSISLFSQQLKDSQVEAWRQCMSSKSEAGAVDGIVRYWDDKHVVVEFHFRPPRGGRAAYGFKLTVTGGTNVAPHDVPNTFHVEQSRTWQFRRSSNETFILTGNVEEFGAFHVELPAPPPLPHHFQVKQSPPLFLISDLRSGNKDEPIRTTHGTYDGIVWNHPVVSEAGEEHGIDLTKYKVVHVRAESENPAQTLSIFKDIEVSMRDSKVHIHLVADPRKVDDNDPGAGGITKIHLVYTLMQLH